MTCHAGTPDVKILPSAAIAQQFCTKAASVLNLVRASCVIQRRWRSVFRGVVKAVAFGASCCMSTEKLIAVQQVGCEVQVVAAASCGELPCTCDAGRLQLH